MSDHLGKDVFKPGFGMMRLPKNEDGGIGIAQACEMVGRFIEAGETYFDTACVYDNGRCFQRKNAFRFSPNFLTRRC